MLRIQVTPMWQRWKIRVLALLLAVLPITVSHAESEQWWNDVFNDRERPVLLSLAQGANPNAKREGEPAAMYAIRNEAWQVYDLFAAHRALDWSATNANDESILMYLAIVGDHERAQTAIQRGAPVSRLGWTPLHYAASKGRVEVAHLLINNGAIVNAPAPDGTMPLMMAALSGDIATIKLLLDAGADPAVRNSNGLNAIDWALNNKQSNAARYIERYQRPVIADPAAQQKAEPTHSETSESRGGGNSGYFDLQRFE